MTNSIAITVLITSMLISDFIFHTRLQILMASRKGPESSSQKAERDSTKSFEKRSDFNAENNVTIKP